MYKPPVEYLAARNEVRPQRSKLADKREHLLRREVHFYAQMVQRLMSWGLTLMISLETVIFFVRRELVLSYVDAGLLKPGQELPYSRYLIGTAFLFAAAFILEKFTKRAVEQFRHYKQQLVGNGTSGIVDNSASGVSDWIVVLYFAFPAFDVLTRIWIEMSVRLH